jgi:protoporphyrinogen oxidase
VGAPPWHWVYLPEAGLRPYRVGSASAAVPSLAPHGSRSFYVEMSAATAVPAAEAEAAARRALLDLGMIHSQSDVLFAETRVIPQAYVIHDRAYGPARDEVRGWLAGRDVLVAGRSGNWEYSSMEDAILGGQEAARRLKPPCGDKEWPVPCRPALPRSPWSFPSSTRRGSSRRPAGI